MTAAGRNGSHPAKTWTSSTARKPRMQPGSVKGRRRSGCEALSPPPPGLRRQCAEMRMASQGRIASSPIASG